MAVLTYLYEQPEKVSLTGNPIAFQWGIANESLLNLFKLKVVVKLWNQTTQVYDSLKAEAVGVDTDGLCTINIAGLLKNRIIGKFIYPESKYNSIYEHYDLVGKYKIEITPTGWDATNNYVEEDPIELADTFYFVEGGQPDEVRQLQTEIYSNWYAQLIEDKKFLTNQPNNKSIHPEQCEKLYWLVREGCTSLKVNLQVNLLDGSVQNITGESASVTPFHICEFTSTLKHYIDNPELVNDYTFWLTDNTGAVCSEIRSYKVNTDWHERNDFLSFLNSLGGYDTLWMNGKKETELSGERKYYPKHLPDIRPRLSNKSFASYRAKVSKNNTNNTGWITQEYADYLAELIMADDVIYLNGDQALPVQNHTEEITPLDDSNDNPPSAKIEWQLGAASRHYGLFNKEIKCPLPPYWNDIAACFIPVTGMYMLDIKGGLRARRISFSFQETISFPVLTPDVLNKSRPEYWSADIPEADSLQRWDVDKITGTHTILYSTELCRSLLFFKDFDGKHLQSVAPVIVFKEGKGRTAAQQQVLVEYMDEYFFVTDNGVIVKDNEDFVIDKN